MNTRYERLEAFLDNRGKPMRSLWRDEDCPGITRYTYRKVRAGTPISIDELFAIADYFDETPEYILSLIDR